MNLKNEHFPDPLSAAFKMDWRLLALLFSVLAFAGGAAFWVGISGAHAQRAWQAFLINFLFWSGLAYGAVVFAAVLNMTKARWARPLKRIAEAPGAFLPVSFALFWLLYYGREEIFTWLHEPVHGKEWWLDVNFLFARDGAGLFLLTAASLTLIYFSVRGDRISASTQAEGSPQEEQPPAGDSPSRERNLSPRGWKVQLVLSPVVGILYALVLSLIAVDLIMSLDPHWVSTLFGAYYFIGSLYTALAALMILTVLSFRTEGFKDYVRPKHMHDLGKLLLAFCLLTGDFFYSQFLVIWYGNLPEEARYVLTRLRLSPWEPLAWTVLVVCFVLPFLTLLSRSVKFKHRHMLLLSGIILVGMWLERMLLVAPSLWKGQGIPIGFMEIAITAGFFGIMALCLMVFFHTVPLIPVSDPLFRKYMEMPKEADSV